MTTDTTRPQTDAPPMFEGRPLPDPTEPAWDQGLAFDVETLIDRRRVLKGIGLRGQPRDRGLRARCGRLRRAPRRRPPHRRVGRGGRGLHDRDPRGDRRSVPGRRLERARRPEPERRRAQGHPSSFGVERRRRRRRAAHDPVRGPGPRERVRADTRAPRSTPGTATRPGATRCTRRASRTRTTCAASRPPATTASSSSRASSRPATRVAGRTSISRSTRASSRRPTRQQDRHVADRAAEGHLRPGVRDGRLRAERQNMRGVSLASDKVFADDGGVHQLGTISGSVADGLVVELAVPVQGLTAATPRRARRRPSCRCRACRRPSRRARPWPPHRWMSARRGMAAARETWAWRGTSSAIAGAGRAGTRTGGGRA